MDSKELDNWRKAGKIAAEVLAYGKSLIKKGALLLEVSDAVDQKIVELGGKPAFPTQISCDHIAAHYCADPDEKTIFDRQVVSLDVGVHVDGCIGDCACTVDLSGERAELVKAAEEALASAIKIAKPNITLGEIGRAIQDAITARGFSPIKNLSGHGLSKFNIHDFPTIPNFDTGDKTQLKEGQIIAIEPFATNGAGMIYETERANIFALVEPRPVRDAFARQVLAEIVKEYKTLPFTTRWLAKKFPLGKVNYALRELLKLEIIHPFPPLPEKNRGIVAQAEHTVLVSEKPEILTRHE